MEIMRLSQSSGEFGYPRFWWMMPDMSVVIEIGELWIFILCGVSSMSFVLLLCRLSMLSVTKALIPLMDHCTQ